MVAVTRIRGVLVMGLTCAHSAVEDTQYMDTLLRSVGVD